MKVLYQSPAEAALLVARVGLIVLYVEVVARLSGLVAGELLLLRAVVVSVLATVLIPRWPDILSPGALARLALWSLGAGLLVVVGAGPGSEMTIRSPGLWRVAAGCALLVWAVAACGQGIAQWLGDRRTGARTAQFGLLLLLALPLWCSPLVALFGASRVLVNVVVALCPISYLASLAGVDYLRSDWFYRYTPYGSLRYDYLDPLGPSLVLLCAPLILCFLLSRWAVGTDTLSLLSEPSESSP